MNIFTTEITNWLSPHTGLAAEALDRMIEIPPDPKLPKELHCASWRQIVTGRLKATPKPEMRKELGRSPDRADAVALAVWDNISTYRPADFTPAQQGQQPGKEWWRETRQQGGQSRRSEEWWRR